MGDNLTSDILESGNKTKSKGGIKAAGFGGNSSNGKSHRANRQRKARQSEANRQTRASINQERGRLGAKEYHMRLDAISSGKAE